MSNLCMFMVLLLFVMQHANAVQFEWGGQGDINFTYEGDASQYGPHEIKLTMGVADAYFHASAGRMRYAHPIPLCTNTSKTHTPSSFNTSFTFQMSFSAGNLSAYRGDGIAFFVSPSTTAGALPSTLPSTKGLFGGLFGNSSSLQMRKKKRGPTVLAVEFDSSQESWDPDGNHVGIDVGSVVSLHTASLNRSGIVLNTGRSITAWIQYDGEHDRLHVYVAYSDDAATAVQKRPHLVLSAGSLGLCSLLMGAPATVGFSSASRGSVETHDLYSWTWQSSTSPTEPDVK